MKLKNNILICSILLGVFLTTSCHKDEENEQVIYEELQGLWDRGDNEITIDGSTGTFSEINSGYALSAYANGFISIGSPKIKNIKKTADNTYTCKELWYHYESGIVTAVYWSSACILTLNETGDTISGYSESSYNGVGNTTNFELVQKD